MTGRARTSPSSGLSLLEVVIALGVVIIAVAGALVAVNAMMRLTRYSKEVRVAALAAGRARENLSAVRFRASSATDADATRPWLFLGGYEVARQADGQPFLLPDLRTRPTASEDGISGCVIAEFPVPPLQAIKGRTHAGKVVFYTDETSQPAPIPAAGFPFPPSRGLAGLDCDGNGTLTTTDLRTGHAGSASPCRMVPVKVAVEWKSDAGGVETYEEFVLLTYQGFD